MIITHSGRLLAAGAIVLGLATSIALAGPALQAHIDVPPVPPEIEVPPGHSVFFKGHAVGTQNFICLPTVSGVSWTSLSPQATLFRTVRGEIHQQNATHFLSANPSENGLPRPTWQHSLDSSQAWGRVLASSSDPNYVEPDAIPWLLLEVTGTQPGPTGGSLFTETTLIHRLNTSGGRAPATGCSQTTEIGRLALVPYEADYYFYGAERRP